MSTRLIEVDERQAKAAILRLNQSGRRIHVLEEAWLAYALVREDGLSQSEVAELLGKHKSWVCRRLALLERLVEEAAGLATGAALAVRGAAVDPVAVRQPEGMFGVRASGVS